MFEGRPSAVTAQLKASQVEITVLHPTGAFFALGAASGNGTNAEFRILLHSYCAP
jgi:hypothetical protein